MMRWLLAAIVVGWMGTALADDIPSAGELRSAAAQAPDLSFPAAPSPLADLGAPRMALFKPPGDGPFPAIVLFHQCGGLGQHKKPNLSMLDWAGRAVDKGYVALLIDALDPRGVDSVCFGPQNGVTFARGVRDAFQAAAHLRTLPYVDKPRVALAGWSWGAMVGVLASRASWADALGDGQPFRAIVSMYPGCFTIQPRNATPFDIAGTDIRTPLLSLLGGQDTETPAAFCQARFEVAELDGAPVQWHLYPDATHCWDCRQLNGFTKVDVRGDRVEYRYNPDVTEDSARRMFDFLSTAMK